MHLCVSCVFQVSPINPRKQHRLQPTSITIIPRRIMRMRYLFLAIRLFRLPLWRYQQFTHLMKRTTIVFVHYVFPANILCYLKRVHIDEIDISIAQQQPVTTECRTRKFNKIHLNLYPLMTQRRTRSALVVANCQHYYYPLSCCGTIWPMTSYMSQ